MTFQLQLGLLLLLLSFPRCPIHALNSDGQALLSFKSGVKGANGMLSYWKEEDEDPCNWPGVTCHFRTKRVIHLNLPFKRLSGQISPSLGNLSDLRRLGLHHNSLFGPIPIELGNCARLKALDLSSNSLNGRIPPSLQNLEKLSLFNVSTNFLSGEIPEDGALSRFGEGSFVGNLQLCGRQVGAICVSQLEASNSSADSFTTPSKGLDGVQKKSRHYPTELLVSALSTIGVSLLVALMCFWGCFLYNKFWKKSKLSTLNLSTEDIAAPTINFFHGDLPYASKEIARRIEMLSESNVIGYGGFGTVYKLEMDDGNVFAVKKIEKYHISSERSFERELEILGSIKHRNLVNLRGYCNVPTGQLLIYDYLPGGNLDEALHGERRDEATFSWSARLKIALGAARGIAYLHHDCWPRIIHRDIKSSNILLGESLEPHVSDFGLAKLLDEGDSHVTTVLAGTFGYLAPEYVQHGRATEKGDVYSYGVVLLELLSGKRPTDPSFVEKGLNIVGWANSLLKEKRLEDIVDPSCEPPAPEKLECVLSIARMCIQSVPDERPTMHMVVKMLEAEMSSSCSQDLYESNSE